MPTVPGLFSARTPDSIEVVVVGDETYILTANEGDDIGKITVWNMQLSFDKSIMIFANKYLLEPTFLQYRIRTF